MDHLAPDGSGDALVAPAVALVRTWLAAGEAALTRQERGGRRRMQLLTGDARSLAFTMSFCDRVLRAESAGVAGDQLRAVGRGPLPPFLSPLDRALLWTGIRLAAIAPSVVMPLTRRRLRQIVGGLVVDRDDPALARHLKRLRAERFEVNVNLLGESVLGEQEARRRLADITDLLARDDIDYVSVKASAVASQLNLWGYDRSLERVKDALRPLYLASSALSGRGTKFINLDMEEYRDLRLTVDSFTGLLSEPDLRGLDAGIVLQAYLPDSFDVLRELVEYATRRHAGGGGQIKVRIVKGANLAMESVDAATHGWQRAPYPTKADTDANYKRMLDWVLTPERLSAVRIGVASHNLFDVAWAHLLAEARGVTPRVEMEMLQGMAPGIDRVVRAATGSVRLYTPVVAEADFDSALAYLFRRLEENSHGENFLRSAFDLSSKDSTFEAECDRFETAVARRWEVSAEPRRGSIPASSGFHNAPDTDPTDAAFRAQVIAALGAAQFAAVPDQITTTEGIDELVSIAREAADGGRSGRRAIVTPCFVRSPERWPLGGVSCSRSWRRRLSKTLSEGDGEVSEAIDMAAYYAEQIPGLRGGRDSEAAFSPFGVVLVTPPWNFPLAIPGGGVFAALAAGNSVLLKAPPQTPRCALAIAEAVWEACRATGIPEEILQYVGCPEEVIGEHLVAHRETDAIILTGAYETAELFRGLAPGTPLFAETSGKNSIVVMPDADLDLAADDLVRSAFGHAGQKCSAASLAICVADVYSSPRFRGQLLDAASSLVLGAATDPATTMAPLIGPAGDSLTRALTALEPGEEWLLEPRLVGSAENLWSPGIKVGVRAGSWFHQTECFGPVLGLIAAADLDEALAIQNGTRFGLTGGIQTLDPRTADSWLARVQVGNAYVNRVITGAVVQRQPFGGWKESVVGPGAKAGGPNYVAQLGHWTDADLPAHAADPALLIADLVQRVEADLDPDSLRWLWAAIRSDAWWQREHFGLDHDPSGLVFEANVLRYKPFGRVIIRLGERFRVAHFVRVLAAATLAGCRVEVSIPPGASGPPLGDAIRESETEFVGRLLALPPDRVRLLDEPSAAVLELNRACYIDASTPVADGLVEGLRYRREQAISHTMHRFGNLIAPARDRPSET